MSSEYRFSIALSFAGDNKRDKVREIAKHLQNKLPDRTVFFDEWFEAEIAGHDAQTFMQNVYRDSSELVVVCVCGRYNDKSWTQEEWRAIQSFERTLRAPGADESERFRFLPIRFADGEIDGLFDTAIVPDMSNRAADAIAGFILERLEIVRNPPSLIDKTNAITSVVTAAAPAQNAQAHITPIGPVPVTKSMTNHMADHQPQVPDRNGLPPFSHEFEEFIRSTEIGYSHRRKDHIELDDIFVYQYLKQQGSDFDKLDDIVDSEEHLSSDKIVEAGLTTVLGTEQSGKTSLSKILLSRLHNEGKRTLWIDGSKITTRDFAKALRRAIKFQYELDTVDLDEKWLSGAVIIIDNYNENRLNANARHSLLAEFKNQGAAVLLFSDAAIRFDEEQYAEISNDTVYQILSLGHQLRDELIAKWIRIGSEDTLTAVEEQSRIKVVADHMNLVVRKGVVPSKPIYVLSIIQLLESATTSDHSLTSYGHCYLTLIVSGFQKAGIPQAEFDAHINLLTEYSFYLHARGLRFASGKQLEGFCKNYAARFFGEEPEKIFRNLILAQLLTDRSDELGFRYPYIDYFYVAKYFSEHLDDESIVNELKTVFDNLHTDRNANILIFLTHHSKEASILSSLLAEVQKLFPDRQQVTLEREVAKTIFNQLEEIPNLVEVRRSAAEEREKHLQARDEVEGLQYDDDDANEVGESEYDELSNEQQNWLVQINRSLRLVEIIGQIMRNRYGSMERKQLEELASSTFEAGFKFLDLYLEALNHDEEHLVQVIEKLLADHKKIHDSKIESSAKKIFLMLCYRACFSVISKIATSIGHEKLTKLYEEIEAKPESTEAQRIVCVSILLEHGNKLPKSSIEKLANDAENNPVVYRLLRELVIRHGYLNHIPAEDRQWLHSKLGLTMDYQRAIQRNKAGRK